MHNVTQQITRLRQGFVCGGLHELVDILSELGIERLTRFRVQVTKTYLCRMRKLYHNYLIILGSFQVNCTRNLNVPKVSWTMGQYRECPMGQQQLPDNAPFLLSRCCSDCLQYHHHHEPWSFCVCFCLPQFPQCYLSSIKRLLMPGKCTPSERHLVSFRDSYWLINYV